ncbi:polyprenyl synthetase family protein, partial [Streptomyces pseudogriseolus]
MTESMAHPTTGRPEQRTARTAPDGAPGPDRHTGDAHTADGHEAAALLERTRAAVDPVLRTALGSLPAPMRRVALYHFGWRNADGTPAGGGSG